MSKPEIISEEPLSLVEVKKEINRIKKRDKEEPGFRVKKVEDYLNTFAKMTQKEHDEIYSELEKLEIPRLRDIHIKKIIDIMPIRLAQLKVVLHGYNVTVSQDNMKKIMGVVKKHLPEDKQ